MKNKNLILYILILLIILPFTSCNKNCDHVFINKTFISQPTCETYGKVLKQCKKCKYEETDILVALGHDYVYETLIEPTCFSNGLQKGVCRRDATHIIEKSLDKT
jgi:hypothetical protein